jgi:hypothetical protein
MAHITEADLDLAPEGLDELLTLEDWVGEWVANLEADSQLPKGVSRFILDALGAEDERI